MSALTQNDTAMDMNPDTSVSSVSNETVRTERRGTRGDLSWFEEMISGSALGRSRRTQRGMGMTADGTTKVEWEVTDVGAGDEDDDSGTGRGKRKIEDLGGRDDVEETE